MFLTFFTSFGFFLPVFLSRRYGEAGLVHTPFFLLLTSQTASSALFWYHPQLFRGTLVHKIDAFLARTSILTVVLHQLSYPRSLGAFFLSTTMMLYFFHLSHIHGNNEWCGHEHIQAHTMAHVYSLVSLWYTFL